MQRVLGPRGGLSGFARIGLGLTLALGLAVNALAQTPAQVKDIFPGVGNSWPSGFVPLGGATLFCASDAAGSGLWKTDGSAAGTVVVKRFHTLDCDGGLVAGHLFFFKASEGSGFSLWRSDGTAAGTFALQVSGASRLTNVQGTLFFDTGIGLWKSDGTIGGTVELAHNVLASDLVDVAGTLFFTGQSEGDAFPKLWKSDGTTAGTLVVSDVRPGVPGSSTGWPTNVNGVLYFSGDDGIHGVELLKSDGTSQGTVIVKDIRPAGAESSNPGELTVVNGMLFFRVQDTDTTYDLWKSDGTLQGTVKVGNANGTQLYHYDLTPMGGKLYFAAYDLDGTYALWRSDGTTAGTYPLKSFYHPSGGDIPNYLTAVGGTLFFTGNEAITGSELWRSDGSSAGTAIVQDTNPGPASAGPYGHLAGDGTETRLFYAADDGATGYELWALDLPRPGLGLTITDGQTSAVPGAAMTYTIVVTNTGPIALAERVSDVVPAALLGATWTCVAAGGGRCAPSGSGSINDTVDLPVGASLTYVFTGTLDPTATGVLTNTVLLFAPGVLDPHHADNSATDIDALLTPAEVSITKNDGVDQASPGQALTYTIVVTNGGPNAVTGAVVTDTLPASLTGALWTCTGSVDGACAASGSGNINDTVNLGVGATVTYTLDASVGPNPGFLSNRAVVTLPAGMGDPHPADNAATDNDTLFCFGETIVVPDGRLTAGALASGATTWLGADLRLGDSYSLEVANSTGSTGSPWLLEVFSGEDACSGTSTLIVKDNSGADPAAAAAARVSFVATGAERFFRARLVNNSGLVIPFALTLSDTTLFASVWSTNTRYNTYYAFQNTSGATIHGTLFLRDTMGEVMATTSVTVLPGRAVGTNTTALGVTRNRTGAATFVHDGPPGAIAATAAMADFSSVPGYVQPVRFRAARAVR